MSDPIFFPDQASWRAWLEEHHAAATEIHVGYFKKHTGRQTELEAAGLMTDAGRAAFALRDPDDAGYSIAEQADQLPDELDALLREDPAAGAFWDACTPGYRRRIGFWIDTGKRSETRVRRVEQLRAACAAGERLDR